MAYNKNSKCKSKYAIGAPKGKTPSRSCYLRKGVLFSAYGPSAIRQATCNGDDRRQWRKQGGAVGAAASRMRAAAKQTLGAATRAPLIKMGGQGRKPIIPLFSPKRYRKRCALPKPLPLGEVALRSNDGEGKPGTKEPLRSDGQALCQSDTIAVSELFGRSLALSVGLAPASSPKGGALGMSVRLSFVQPLSLLRRQLP